MITIYNANETAFDTMGLGALVPVSCVITEDINGQYELDMQHPIDPEGKWERIANDRIIKASTHDGDQLFRIYSAVKNPITGRIEVNARHIFYDLLDNLIEDTRPTVRTGQQAGNDILAGCQYATPFSFTSNITAASTAYYIRVNPVQALIGAIDQAFIARWGGEIRRNNFAISINTRRGSDKGIRIAYGKNLTGLEATEDISQVYTRIMPTAVNESNVLFTTDAKYYDSPLIGNYSRPKIGILNTGIRVGREVNGVVPYTSEAAAKAAMPGMATAAFEAGADKPKLTINVSFIRWQDTDEYAAFKDLYTLELGDDVTVDYQPLSLTYNLRVTSIIWDAVLNKAVSLTLGDLAPSIAKAVADASIDLSALRNDVAGALQEGQAYNNVTITNKDGIITSAVIGGVLVEVKQNAQEGFALYAGGVYVGGIKIVGDKAVLVSNVLTNDVDGDCYTEIGNFVDGGITYNGIFIYRKVSGTFQLVSRLVVSPTGIHIRDLQNRERLAIYGGTTTKGLFLKGENGVDRFSATEDAAGWSEIRSPNGNIVFNGNNIGVTILHGSGQLGVDSGGPFYVKSGSKVYF